MRADDQSGRWAIEGARHRWQWHDWYGKPCAPPDAAAEWYVVAIVLTIAHKDHHPEHNSDENLAAWCQRCHLVYDQRFHRTTRNLRHDREVGQQRIAFAQEQEREARPHAEQDR